MEVWCVMVTLRILFSPHSLTSFRKPSSYGTLAHGPGTAGDSLSYPFPSTLAGVLAGIAYQRGLCSPPESWRREWDDVRGCLQSLFGGDVRLYSGFAMLEGEDELRYYTPYGYISRGVLAEFYRNTEEYSVDRLVKAAVREPRLEYTGIALRRDSKTVLEEHLYTTYYLAPGAIRLSYTILIDGSSILPPSINGETVRMGGDGKTATIHVEEAGGDLSTHLILGDGGGCGKWMLQLVTPALLDKTPWTLGEPILLDEEHGLKLASLLLGGEVRDKVKTVILTVPKTDPTITILAPGWSIAMGRPRRPHLLIPPGTTIAVEAELDTIESLVARGLGEHVDLGWGTTIAVCTG